MRNIFRPYGPRGYAMLSLSLVAIFRAIDYLKPAQPGYTPSALRELAAIIPTPVWGVLWGITGVWVLVAAFRERQAIALAEWYMFEPKPSRSAGANAKLRLSRQLTNA